MPFYPEDPQESWLDEEAQEEAQEEKIIKNQALIKLQRMLDDATDNYILNKKNDYDAGILEGIKRAYELLSSL